MAGQLFHLDIPLLNGQLSGLPGFHSKNGQADRLWALEANEEILGQSP